MDYTIKSDSCQFYRVVKYSCQTFFAVILGDYYFAFPVKFRAKWKYFRQSIHLTYSTQNGLIVKITVSFPFRLWRGYVSVHFHFVSRINPYYRFIGFILNWKSLSKWYLFDPIEPLSSFEKKRISFGTSSYLNNNLNSYEILTD